MHDRQIYKCPTYNHIIMSKVTADFYYPDWGCPDVDWNIAGMAWDIEPAILDVISKSVAFEPSATGTLFSEYLFHFIKWLAGNNCLKSYKLWTIFRQSVLLQPQRCLGVAY